MVVYIQGTNAQLADMDVDCNREIQSDNAKDDGRCQGPSSDSYELNPATAFRNTVQSDGKGIEDLDPNIHLFIVLGNDFNRGDMGSPLAMVVAAVLLLVMAEAVLPPVMVAALPVTEGVVVVVPQVMAVQEVVVQVEAVAMEALLVVVTKDLAEEVAHCTCGFRPGYPVC
ncbi:hypothetical protein E8E14_000536 [Neopestalotiopsis sp. 37M]|nr:hypothetical protein E8E14_000536 [Neopestalotiopsis sp. 37M]